MLKGFDEWKSKQSQEDIKQFYDNLEKVNNNEDDWLELKCRQMQRCLEPIYDRAEYDCKICNNSGQVFEIVSHGTSKCIVCKECECMKRRKV